MSFFFELYTEEIPATYQPAALRHWQKQLPLLLKENLIDYKNIELWATSRRLTCYVQDIGKTQIEKEQEIKGPPKSICYDATNNATDAMQGFAQKAQVSIEEIFFKPIGKQEYAFALQKSGGKKTLDILPALIEKIITTTHFPRQMRWANFSFLYARPILGYYGYFYTQPVHWQGSLWNVISPMKGVHGHQVLHAEAKEVKNFSEYQNFLSSCEIILNPEEREKKIAALLQSSAQSLGLQAIIPSALLKEVNFLVEKAAVIWAEFPASFLTLPEKVILSEMEKHQRYFAMRCADGSLSAKFLIVTNGNQNDAQAIENIKAGNERVLKARLSDGKFFFDEDRKQPLKAGIEKLKKIVFQEGMGNMWQKKERVKQIALSLLQLHSANTAQNKTWVASAADLCKADLSSQLVYEFDSLQGEIGSVYARLDGEPAEVVQAIREHYLPKFQGDDFPQTLIGVLLSLADKFDNIISGFLLDKAPSSNQDPLGLRRQCLYVIEIIIENKFSFELEDFLPLVANFYPQNFSTKFETLQKDMVEFFKGRVVTIFDKEGFDKKMIRAALLHATTNILQLNYRLAALRELQKNQDFHFMMGAFKRMNNIVADQNWQTTHVQENLLHEKEERELFYFCQELEEKLLPLQTQQAGEQDYMNFYIAIASAKEKIDDFFAAVMVNHEENAIRRNRLSLLLRIVSAAEQVIALSEF